MKKKLQFVAIVFGKRYVAHSENSLRTKVALANPNTAVPSFSVTSERRA